MAQLLVRDIDPTTKRALEIRAAQHGVSQQAEALRIIREAVAPEGSSWVARLRDKAEAVGGMEFELPKRHAPRLTGVEL